jgi:hypothetical protein
LNSYRRLDTDRGFLAQFRLHLPKTRWLFHFSRNLNEIPLP